MTIEEKILRYEAIRKEYQEKIYHRMSKEQYEEYSEILFSTHSCAIEGNSFTVDDTRALKELGLGMVPHGRKLLECMEMADHLRAYEYVMQNLDHPLDEAFLKHINFLLTEHTIGYHAPDAIAGGFFAKVVFLRKGLFVEVHEGGTDVEVGLQFVVDVGTRHSFGHHAEGVVLAADTDGRTGG